MYRSSSFRKAFSNVHLGERLAPWNLLGKGLGSAIPYFSQTKPVRLVIPLTGCVSMGIEPVTSDVVYVHYDQFVPEEHTMY